MSSIAAPALILELESRGASRLPGRFASLRCLSSPPPRAPGPCLASPWSLLSPRGAQWTQPGARPHVVRLEAGDGQRWAGRDVVDGVLVGVRGAPARRHRRPTGLLIFGPNVPRPPRQPLPLPRAPSSPQGTSVALRRASSPVLRRGSAQAAFEEGGAAPAESSESGRDGPGRTGSARLSRTPRGRVSRPWQGPDGRGAPTRLDAATRDRSRSVRHSDRQVDLRGPEVGGKGTLGCLRVLKSFTVPKILVNSHTEKSTNGVQKQRINFRVIHIPRKGHKPKSKAFTSFVRVLLPLKVLTELSNIGVITKVWHALSKWETGKPPPTNKDTK